MALARQKLGWHHPPFEIPKEIYHAWDAREKAKAQQSWNEKFAAYKRLIRNWQKSFPRMSGGYRRTGKNGSEIYQ